MEQSAERRYAGLSPFELKNRLVALAQHRAEHLWLNAGRGNPNWLALEPRATFFLLGEFALTEARRVALAPGFGGLPQRRRVYRRLRGHLDAWPASAGRALLERGMALAEDRFGFDAPTMSVRVSLANLPDAAYGPIGRAIVELLDDYHARWHGRRTGGERTDPVRGAQAPVHAVTGANYSSSV